MSDDTFEYITTDYLVQVDSEDTSEPTIEYIVELGEQGVPGIPGEKGDPGFSPTVGYILNDNTFKINITNQDGVTQTPNLYDYFASQSDLATKLDVDGSNANNPITINGILLRGYSGGIGRISTIGTLQLHGSNTNIYGSSVGIDVKANSIDLGNWNTGKYLEADTTVKYGTSSTKYEIATVNDISDATITLTQGGVTKGTFTLNGSATTIDLDEGGGSITNPLEIVGEPYGSSNAQQKIAIKAGTGSDSLNDIELGLKPFGTAEWITTSAYLISRINNPLSISSNASGLGRTLSLNYDSNTLDLNDSNALTVKDVFLNKDGSNATNDFKIHNTELTQNSVDISNVSGGGFSVTHASNNNIYAQLSINNSKGLLHLPSISIASYPYSGTLHSNYNEIVAYGDIIITNGASYKLYYGAKNANNEVAKIGDIPTTMTGADGTNAGTAGLVPAPTATDNTKFLCGDGTWKTVSSGTTYTAGTGIDITNDTISIDTSVVAQLSDIPDTSDMATKTWVGNQGYLTSITSGDVTTALGYTPYDSSNPNGYTNNVGTVTSVNNVLPINGNVTLSIPSTTYMVTTNTKQTITASKVFDDSGILFYDEINDLERNGITYNESVGVYVGDTGERLLLQGKDTRPYYNNNSLALFSDIPSLSGYVTTSDLTTTLANYVLSSSLATVATSGSYNDLSNKPTIPTDTSDLTNNAGFITSSALSGYATQTWVGQQGYLTSINSSDVTNALGYTPYSSSNPDGYTSNVGTVTSVNNTQPDANGNVTLSLTPTVIDGGNA